jgi:hypothetical protein
MILSLTKIVATLPNVMLQYDQQKINLETTLGTMSPKKIQIRPISILKICFLITLDWRLEYRFIKPQWTIRNFLRKLFLEKYLKKISKRLCGQSFIRNDFSNTIMDLIVKSKISIKYKYNDLTFMILKDLEKTTT